MQNNEIIWFLKFVNISFYVISDINIVDRKWYNYAIDLFDYNGQLISKTTTQYGRRYEA